METVTFFGWNRDRNRDGDGGAGGWFDTSLFELHLRNAEKKLLGSLTGGYC